MINNIFNRGFLMSPSSYPGSDTFRVSSGKADPLSQKLHLSLRVKTASGTPSLPQISSVGLDRQTLPLMWIEGSVAKSFKEILANAVSAHNLKLFSQSVGEQGRQPPHAMANIPQAQDKAAKVEVAINGEKGHEKILNTNLDIALVPIKRPADFNYKVSASR
jgi:hypothetical protein